MRVVSYEPDSSVVKQKVCSHCGVKLEYVPNDVQIRYEKDYTGCVDTVRYIVCPVCHKETHVR